jgi:hypothetical protein
MKTIWLRGFAPLALASLAALALLGAAASAQTRQEMADKVVKQHDAPSAACALLSDDEVVKITGQRSYQQPKGTQLINGGSACDYDGANLTLFCSRCSRRWS